MLQLQGESPINVESHILKAKMFEIAYLTICHLKNASVSNLTAMTRKQGMEKMEKSGWGKRKKYGDRIYTPARPKYHIPHYSQQHQPSRLNVDGRPCHVFEGEKRDRRLWNHRS